MDTWVRHGLKAPVAIEGARLNGRLRNQVPYAPLEGCKNPGRVAPIYCPQLRFPIYLGEITFSPINPAFSAPSARKNRLRRSKPPPAAAVIDSQTHTRNEERNIQLFTEKKR